VRRTLLQAGFRVEEEGTGEGALRRVRANPPDIVVLDVKLPDINGFEVARRLKADPATASVPVLQMTATYASSKHWAEALDSGADAYLTHPSEPIVLVATIRALLRAREAEKALREANRVKDEFLATLSHELRTPLNAIVGWAHVLRTPGLDPAVMTRALDSIQRNAEAQTRLISDILDVSRVIAGKLRIQTGRVELATVVEAAVETVRPAAQARRIALEVTLDPHAVVPGDASRLQQIAWNLLTNAVKFTPPDGTVRVTLRRVPPAVELVVEDTGMGIEAAFLPFVFDRFRQADASMTRTVSGLGLGLALVHDLVQLHGGTVRAESAGLGQGARFTILLPTALAPPEVPAPELPLPASAKAAAAAAAATPIALTGVRMLLVDDDTDFLESLKVIFESYGAQVTCSASAEKALAALDVAPFDVLVSDLGMPGEDGYGLIRAVRARPAERGGHIPAVALSAYVADHDRAQSLAQGFQIHLGKPADPTALAQSIAALIGHGARGAR
ncbi:MAG TPA: response regulator, partial [Vicinamibacteria bacterium]|nr:response regulator [Vicinamibacteria bacterium]